MDKCTYCQENKWDPDGEGLTPVFWKDSSGDPIHLKCYQDIEDNPDKDKVKVWKMLGYIEKIDFVKTTASTPESLQALIMDKRGITQAMINSHLKGVTNG